MSDRFCLQLPFDPRIPVSLEVEVSQWLAAQFAEHLSHFLLEVTHCSEPR